MKVAIYHPWVYLKGGAERTVLELMQRSRHEWTLYTNHYDPEGTFPEFRDLPVVQLARVSVRRTLVDVGLASLRAVVQSIPLQGAAALMVSSEGLGNLITLRPRGVPVFCFCHTPLKVVYDPFTRSRYFSEQPSRRMRAALALYTAIDRLGWHAYERVFCNSREVAGRVLGAGLAPSHKVEVIHPGVDLRRFDPHGPREPFFLLAGRIARTKTIELGVDAFIRLKEAHPAAAPFRLVVAGMVDHKSQPYLEAMLERAQGRRDIEFVIGPSDEQLLDLYRRCYATLFAALNEDWGLVVLEAMASGKPVIAVDRGGPRESVVHGETGLLCPAEAEAFAAAMGRLVDDPARAAAMGLAGRQRAAAFPWHAFAERIDDYVDFLVECTTRPLTFPLPWRLGHDRPRAAGQGLPLAPGAVVQRAGR
jgi:glycosyltransferase involved in cell wall biosynthesis